MHCVIVVEYVTVTSMVMFIIGCAEVTGAAAVDGAREIMMSGLS